jgi:hypothetical protein
VVSIEEYKYAGNQRHQINTDEPLSAAHRSGKAFAVITTLHGLESLHERLGTAISSLLIRSKNGKSAFFHELCRDFAAQEGMN